jgi:hypothetical protein
MLHNPKDLLKNPGIQVNPLSGIELHRASAYSTVSTLSDEFVKQSISFTDLIKAGRNGIFQNSWER